MTDNRFSCAPVSCGKETVCIEANRILDSCRDRDCYENVRVFLTCLGNEIIERTGNIRVKNSCITWASVTVDPIAFNKGFYSVNIRLYIKITFEACIAPGRIQEFDGVAVIEKSVVLFGGESNLNVFKASGNSDFCAKPEECCSKGSLPTAVFEVVDPIILNAKIVEKHSGHCHCCCCCSDIPDGVCASVNGALTEDGERYLAVSVGIFSVVRIVRPAQYLIQASEYSVPDKECLSHSEENPCDIFKCMAFPTQEFSAGHIPAPQHSKSIDKHCGCQ